MISNDEKLLFAAKVIVKDMDDLARLRIDVPVFFGMGQALNRIYCILRNIPFSQIPTIVPIEMMAWIRDQKLPGLDGTENVEQMIKKGLAN